jgi:cell division protein FtsB
MNKAAKRLVLRLAFGAECLAFALFFIKSLDSINNMKLVNVALEKDIECLSKDIASVQQQVDEWNSDSFYKEQLAREKLQMANAKDEIYYV